MTSPIDPIRRATHLRRARKAQAERAERAKETETSNLPAPLDPLGAAPRRVDAPAAAAFDAQLLGQAGQKRGLRGGPAVIDTAAASYNRTEWSGAKDRRARKGGITKTEI